MATAMAMDMAIREKTSTTRTKEGVGAVGLDDQQPKVRYRISLSLTCPKSASICSDRVGEPKISVADGA